jgi:hypothetical protein
MSAISMCIVGPRVAVCRRRLLPRVAAPINGLTVAIDGPRWVSASIPTSASCRRASRQRFWRQAGAEGPRSAGDQHYGPSDRPFHIADRSPARRGKGAGQDAGGPDQLRFAILGRYDRDQVRACWQDGEEGRLERFIQEIAVEVVTSAEISYREN